MISIGRYVAVTAVLAAVSIYTAADCNASVHFEEGTVVFSLEEKKGRDVYVAGDFNGWNPSMDKMIWSNGRYMIRLFLIPGRYRYRFIVDGASIPDPGNINRDEEGNSYFILRERSGTYEVVFRGAVAVAGHTERIDTELSGKSVLILDPDSEFLYTEGRFKGSIGEKAEAEFSLGGEYGAEEEEKLGGRTYLLGATGVYRTGNMTLLTFSRADRISFEDPASFFGKVGPYDYELGRFCRGIMLEGTAPMGIKMKVLYASRIYGYVSGPGSSHPDSTENVQIGLFDGRNPTDSDIVGVRLGGRLGSMKVRYLMRHDRRPKEGAWEIPEETDILYRGFEKRVSNGLWCSISGVEGATIDVEYISGRSYICSIERSSVNVDWFMDHDSEMPWEKGYRLHAGVSYGSGKLDLDISSTTTVIDGEPQLREGRRRGSHSILSGDLVVKDDEMHFLFRGELESFSAMNTGDVFWIQRNNFFLDGDGFTLEDLPFFKARGVYELRFGFLKKSSGDAPCLYGRDVECYVTQKGDVSEPGSCLREIVLRKGLALHDQIKLVLDGRYISYQVDGWTGKRDYLDLYCALSSSITDFIWCSVGFGVNPYSFDRWLYGFSRYGREKYLFDSGLLDKLSGTSRPEILESISDAEGSLSEDWMISFETVVRF